MHDPLVVAFTIRRPWPKRVTWPTGKRLWWPSLITIWHTEPDGRDAFEVCKHSGRWRWHVHHWRIQVHPLQHLRRWALTRCTWCGGRSRKGDYVNCSMQWDSPRGRWWRGEPDLFHADCSSIAAAHRTCTCWVGPYEFNDYGRCASCGLYKGWKRDEERDPTWPGNLAEALLATVPVGHRDPTKTAQAAALWTEARALRDKSQPSA